MKAAEPEQAGAKRLETENVQSEKYAFKRFNLSKKKQITCYESRQSNVYVLTSRTNNHTLGICLNMQSIY